MKHIITVLMTLIISFSRCAQADHSRYFLPKQLEHKAKPALATTSISLGTYLLYGTLQTAFDMNGEPQQNSGKGIALNALIAAGLITFGSYLLKEIWDENNPENENKKQ